MWDLTVAETHAFYIATPVANVLVHNCPAPKLPEDLPGNGTPTTPEVPTGPPTTPGVREGNIPHDQRVAPATPAQRAAAGERNEERNGGTKECLYCGEPIENGETEHIISRAKGGTNDDSNLDRACVSCNRSKSDKDVDEFLDRKGFTPSEESRQVIDDAIRTHQERLASQRPSGPAELRQQQEEQFRDAIDKQRSDAVESARETGQSDSGEPGSNSGTQSSQRKSESKKPKKQSTAHKHRKGQK
jgi:5-methylcytosine-specific restriction endonuclease McrA